MSVLAASWGGDGDGVCARVATAKQEHRTNEVIIPTCRDIAWVPAEAINKRKMISWIRFIVDPCQKARRAVSE